MGIRSVAVAITAVLIIDGSAYAQKVNPKVNPKIAKFLEKEDEAVRRARKTYEEATQRSLDKVAKELEKNQVPSADEIVRNFRDDIAARDAQAAPPAPPPPNPSLSRDVWDFNGHRYTILRLPRQLSWGEAKVECESRGGHLVTVETRAEQDFLNKKLSEYLAGQQQLNRKTLVWLGLWRPDATRQFAWIGNRQIAFTNWAFPMSDQVKNNYGAMRMEDGQWWDAPEQLLDVYTLCEWDTVR